jgi:hypothetical protein
MQLHLLLLLLLPMMTTNKDTSPETTASLNCN